jgi:hypothetical protein
MANYTNFKRRWNVNGLGSTGNPWNLKSTDFLTFEGDGTNTLPLGTADDVLTKTDTTVFPHVATIIGNKCRFISPDKVEVEHQPSLLEYVITITVNPTPKPPNPKDSLRCKQKNSGTGTTWTAEEG